MQNTTFHRSKMPATAVLLKSRAALSSDAAGGLAFMATDSWPKL